MNAREVIASSACAHGSAEAWGALSTHNHTECLAEADRMLESLRLAGYRVIGVTQIPEMGRAAKAIHGADGPCNNDLCVCRPRS